MTRQYILSDYLDRALSQAEYDKLEDGTFFGRIPACKGVVAFAATLRPWEDELRSVSENWVLVGLKLGHELPVLDGIDLNGNFIALRRDKKYENTHARFRSAWRTLPMVDWNS